MTRLEEIKERAKACSEVEGMLGPCPHGRDPVDRCDVCCGDDLLELIREVERLRDIIEEETQWHYEEFADGSSRSLCWHCSATLGNKHDADCRRFNPDGTVK